MAWINDQPTNTGTVTGTRCQRCGTHLTGTPRQLVKARSQHHCPNTPRTAA